MDKPVLHVCRGDRVHLVFDHYREDDSKREFDAYVLEVEQRYGRCNNGKTYPRDLLTYLPVPEAKIGPPVIGKHHQCDVGWVTKIVEHGPARVIPYNYFKRARNDVFPPLPLPACGSVHGTLKDLIIRWLSYADVEAKTFVDWGKVANHFGRITGITKIDRFGLVHVNVKSFKKWMAKNYKKLLFTAAEYDRIETERNKKFEEAYWADVAAEWERGDANE